jgi:hypothetical protein
MDYIRNLQKTFELIQISFDLKEAYYRQRFPAESHEQIRDRIHREIIERKKRQWKSQAASSAS